MSAEVRLEAELLIRRLSLGHLTVTVHTIIIEAVGRDNGTVE